MRRVVAKSVLSIRRTPRWTAAHFATSQPLLNDITVPHDVTGENQTRNEGRAKPWRHQRGGGPKSSTHGHNGPVKDRFPPILTNLSDPRRRLAILLDASSVEPRVFYNTVFPAAKKVGVPVLVRIFAVQLSSEWESHVAGSDGAKMSGRDLSSSSGAEAGEKTKICNEEQEERTTGNTSSCPPVEFFRVERFIPVSMQMEADANHIFDFRLQNKIEAVCFVCTEVDRGVFEGFLPNIAGNGFNQYILDELGMAKEVLEDGRSADGSPL
ncbi:hypothetical protein C3747_13g460 [Trypanosoma cruzi]|uniref:Uncharacterized protein n=2 Tax=Trypanosoma cruzi TaxID=5693 RepID=Q4D969_TRYCC|nr:hypothetical protein, conserved [Trypanosoma cruzi]EAN89073.1 hypothetical protein, conserved [Trypanosoma cruzi]PWV18397.1 hypothetical protein C3747_13g460 [Trypanosoma cruzi]RNC61720.1 hypothetical protein TcCL_ESM00571 [Trypanosoma cruzi]|eukprot:XP_810924.1 hypothetical protein [Trypanosoma cruzi strain CL Brener]